MNDDFKPWPIEELNSLKSEIEQLKIRIQSLEEDLIQCTIQRDEYQQELLNTRMQLAHLDR